MIIYHDIEIFLIINIYFCLRDENDYYKNREISLTLSYRNNGADKNDVFKFLYYFYFGTSIRNFAVESWWGNLVILIFNDWIVSGILLISSCITDGCVNRSIFIL